MEIKTKFVIGDKVWHLFDGKVTQTEITSIKTVIHQYKATDGIKERIETEYAGELELSDTLSMDVRMGRDDRCFATREELINYVISE